MAEYIERTEELMLAVNAGARVIENTKRYHGASYCIGVFSADHKEIPYLKAAEVLRGFDGIPAADVAPVRHARWVDNHCTACGMMPMGDEMWKHCDFEPPRFERFMDYCPICGCRMDG